MQIRPMSWRGESGPCSAKDEETQWTQQDSGASANGGLCTVELKVLDWGIDPFSEIRSKLHDGFGGD